eukprot:83330_1
MSSDWKVPEAPRARTPLNTAAKSINYEAAAFTQHEKLLWITEDRISKFLDDTQWTDCNLSKHRLYYEKCAPVSMEVYSPDPKIELRPLFNTVMKQSKWTKCKVNDSFGPSWSSHWFKLVLNPKESWDKNGEIHLIWNSNTEATLWNENGKCLQGLAGGTDQIREEYMFDSNTKYPLTVYVEMACSNRFGVGDDFLGPPPPDKTYKVEKCELGLFNRKAWDLIWDLRVIQDLIKKLDKKSQQRLQILRATNNILNIIDPLDENTYAKGRQLAGKILYGNNYNSEQKYDDKNDNNIAIDEHIIYAVANCHIDTAWLWPYGETRRKVIRSWSSQLRLMQLYNTSQNNLNYQFTASQAQQFQWLLEDCPELFKRIQEHSANNTFHIVGGTWVEMDGNIPSGEGFVRQFLYGQEFYLKHFGRRCKIFWLPDTFGYSGQLPQIIRQSDIDYFLTQKLSWNLINKFPHHSFLWEGIDGSDVLTHFPPADTYVAQCNIGDVLNTISNYKNKSCNNESIMLYGWGDGGGGPTTMHLERLKRYTKGKNGMKNIPKIKMSGPLEFFNKLKQSVNKLPRYVGELYFELHRGTYTSHALLKKGNRQSELTLQFVEFIYSILSIKSDGKIKYPKDEIDKLWKLVLLNQFHDVLPGSSIELANIDAREIYDQVSDALGKLISVGMMQFSEYLAGKNVVEQDDILSVKSKGCIVNNRSWRRKELLNICNKDVSILSEDDMKLSQTTYDKGMVIMVESKPYSISPLQAIQSMDTVSIKENKKNNCIIMENKFIYVEILSNGVINSLIHKQTNKQVIKIDANSDNIGGNNFLLFEDKPLFWEAWDVEIYHLQKYVSFRLMEKNEIKLNENQICLIHGYVRQSHNATTYKYHADTPYEIIYVTSMYFDNTKPYSIDDMMIEAATDYNTIEARTQFIERKLAEMYPSIDALNQTALNLATFITDD